MVKREQGCTKSPNTQLFEVREPLSHTIPFVYNSPHSGRIYPPEFIAQSRLEGVSIRRSEDHYVDELFADASALGAPLLLANFPRAYLDVNREPYELDPRMFDGSAAALRKHQFAARGGRAWHYSAHRCREHGNLRPAAVGAGGAGSYRERLQAVSCGAAAADCPHACAVRLRRADRLPLDAG